MLGGTKRQRGRRAGGSGVDRVVDEGQRLERGRPLPTDTVSDHHGGEVALKERIGDELGQEGSSVRHDGGEMRLRLDGVVTHHG